MYVYVCVREWANLHQTDSGLSPLQQLQSFILGVARKGLEVIEEDTPQLCLAERMCYFLDDWHGATESTVTYYLAEHAVAFGQRGYTREEIKGTWGGEYWKYTNREEAVIKKNKTLSVGIRAKKPESSDKSRYL